MESDVNQFSDTVSGGVLPQTQPQNDSNIIYKSAPVKENYHMPTIVSDTSSMVTTKEEQGGHFMTSPLAMVATTSSSPAKAVKRKISPADETGGGPSRRKRARPDADIKKKLEAAGLYLVSTNIQKRGGKDLSKAFLRNIIKAVEEAKTTPWPSTSDKKVVGGQADKEEKKGRGRKKKDEENVAAAATAATSPVKLKQGRIVGGGGGGGLRRQVIKRRLPRHTTASISVGGRKRRGKKKKKKKRKSVGSKKRGHFRSMNLSHLVRALK